ncbi:MULTISPECIES: PQQ-dependent sugar dehydrogenase [unclassified Mesorhizobium]|uniref:PQQ-dependent sugar dehydrogenase n=1 Tax=unclassified Mesorhizobium TaxID=325217 RepID=UPI001CCA213B|nr:MULTISPECIES: sorbosone dehydrogenase family protein [unclassified Mesorhizobium]MBZ9738034.1 sorbosone dehydrogenase family protein [Mesorhizobium sp. CO1-1-4]MBZ9803657.1 sorbosone dehydrogenase family protein [Mesorhizobium sp. ES1-6]
MIRLASMAAIPVSLIIAGSALAADQPVLKGPAAFGDWRADRPGVRRLIKPEDLPKPYVTKSASNSAGLADMPADAKPQLPPGFSAQLIASGIDNPRVVRVAPNGDLFVADSEANQVRVYRLTKGGAQPAEQGVFAGNLNQPYGIAFYPLGNDPQWVYVANSDSIVRFPYRSGELKASGEPETIIDNIPASHHWTRDIAFSPDGKTLYLSVGSGSNVAEDMGKEPEGGLETWVKLQPIGATWGSEEGRADVRAFDPDGKNGRIVATGLRNCSGMTIQPATGALWCVVNERDALGDNVPAEYATSVRDGAFYGWPWYYIGGNEDPRHKGERPDLAGKATVPDVLMQAHSAPLNIAFYTGKAFPQEYQGDAFVALHGSWNRGNRTGYKVVRLLFKDGKPTGEYEDFMTGFVVSNGEVWGRPVGVAVANDGALIVTEDGNGTIWRVTYGDGRS